MNPPPPPDHDLQEFTEIILPILAPSEVRFVAEMYTLAEKHHGAQTRYEVDDQGTPKRYFSHPLAVARLLIEQLGCRDPETIAAALLHDVLEDTQLSAEDLESFSGTAVTREVILLSQLNGESKAEYAGRLMLYAGTSTLLLKVCDILHNARTFRACPPDKQRHFVDAVRIPYAPLLDHAIELADPRVRPTVAKMVTEIRELVSTLDRPASIKDNTRALA